MDKKQSQKTFVKQELAKHGFITRNKCLRNYISRLSAIIFDLKDEGFEFETKFVENTTAYGTERDFVYLWKNRKDGKLETTYFFKWFDADGFESTTEIDAKSFDEACAIFLTQSQLFLEEIFAEVHTKVGCIFVISDRQDFSQLKIRK